MSSQLELFSTPTGKHHPIYDYRMVRRLDHKTSIDAAKSVLTTLNATLAKVYEYICANAREGVTDEQIAIALKMKENTASKRRGDLASPRYGLVIDSHKRRKTTTGRLAIVWCPTSLFHIDDEYQCPECFSPSHKDCGSPAHHLGTR